MKLTPKQREALQKLLTFGPMSVKNIYEGKSNMPILCRKGLAYHKGYGLYDLTDLGRKTITEGITKINAVGGTAHEKKSDTLDEVRALLNEPPTLRINLSADEVATFVKMLSDYSDIGPMSYDEEKLYNRLQSEIEIFKSLRK